MQIIQVYTIWSKIPNSLAHRVTHCLPYGALRIANYDLSYLYVRVIISRSLATRSFWKTTANQSMTNLYIQVLKNLHLSGNRLSEKDNIALIILQNPMNLSQSNCIMYWMLLILSVSHNKSFEFCFKCLLIRLS